MALSSLACNTMMMYLLAISSQVINVVTIPYQTRVLGPSLYGVVGVVVGVMGIVAVVVDFGFMLSATKMVSENRNSPEALSEILSSVTISKILLALMVLCVLSPFVFMVKVLKDNVALFVLYCIAYVSGSMLPDYLYRGMERMTTMVVRTVLIRSVFALLVFVFVRSRSDVLLLPVLLLGGNVCAIAFSFVELDRRYGVRLQKVSASLIASVMKTSAPFFASRSAATIYQSFNAVVLGVVCGGSVSVGLYMASEKILNLVKALSSPVADSLYPYMLRTRNYGLCRRILVIACPLLFCAGVVLFEYAGEVCSFVFGTDYYDAGELVRCLVPAMMVIFPTYIICFPVLVPMGCARQANCSTFIGAAIQLLLVGALLVSGELDAMSICVAASISEVAVFAFRLGMLVKNRMRASHD